MAVPSLPHERRDRHRDFDSVHHKGALCLLPARIAPTLQLLVTKYPSVCSSMPECLAVPVLACSVVVREHQWRWASSRQPHIRAPSSTPAITAGSLGPAAVVSISIGQSGRSVQRRHRDAPVRPASVCCVACQLLRAFLVRVYSTEEREVEGVPKVWATSASQLLHAQNRREYCNLVDALHTAVCSQCDPTKKITLWFRTRSLTNERQNVPLPATEDPTQVTKHICALRRSLQTGTFPNIPGAT